MNSLNNLSRLLGKQLERRVIHLTRPLANVLCYPFNNLHPNSIQARQKMTDNSPKEPTIAKDNAPDINKLSKMQYKVTQEKYTEPPFTGKFNQFKKKGTYECIVCNSVLFKSEHKFESGCGWPAFFDSVDPTKIKEVADDSHGMSRIEVLCANCDAHLGHVFDDGPKPTRRRFCINSVSMRFIDPSGVVEQDDGLSHDS